MMLCKKPYSLQLSLMLVALAVSCRAFAAADSQTLNDLLKLSVEELQQIKVTVASPFRESDLVAGSTVALITKKDWRLAGAQRSSDAISHLPSTMVLPGMFASEAIAVRGYALSTRGLATLIDGVPVNSFATGTAQYGIANFGLGLLNNIEMIRGPGSAIYGTDAFHGVVALNTFASETDSDAVGATLGSNGYYQGSVQDSRQLSSSLRSNFAFSASGQGDQDRRYSYRDTNRVEQSGSRDFNYGSQTGVLKLVSDETQPWSYRWGLYWDSYKAEQFPGFGRALSGNKSALADKDWSGADNRFAMTNVSITRQLPQQITAQLNNFYWRNTTLWSSHRPFATGVGEVVTDQINSRQGSELMFKQADNAWHTQWVAAIGYNEMEVNDAGDSTFAGDGSLLEKKRQPFSGLGRNINYTFLQARTSFYDEKLQLLYGGRVDDYSDFGVKRTPRLGMIFLPEPDLAFKLLYGEAFRAPIASELTPSSFTKGNPNLKPESNRTYEFIVLQRRDHSKIELNFFKNQWRDGIITAPSSDPNYRLEFANLSRNSAQGLELSYQLISNPWLADLSASYVRSESDLTQTVYGAFPRVIINAGFGYQLQSGWQFYINNRFFGDAKQTNITAAIPNPESLPSYWRADFHIGKAITPQLHVDLDIKNLFDRTNYLPSMAAAEGGVLDEPFSASLGLRYRF